MTNRQGLKHLCQLYQVHFKERYPNVPYIPSPQYKDTTANGLNKCILHFLRYSGHQAERISVTGRQIDRRVTYTDVLGNRRQIGNLEWIKTSMQPGTADISAIINGRAVKIEIKIGRDRQRNNQAKYQQSVESAGGFYFIATSFQSFYEWYQSFMNNE